jgi:hypothetical protein
MSKPTAPIVLPVSEWNTSQIRYMQPKINDRGSKSINIISTQSNRSLAVSTPLMMTWGVSDFVDEKTGESDGKYKMSLNFPNDQYRKPATDEFLKKLKEFESQILDDAVKNSELWFGEEMPRDVVKHMFFPTLKYSKDKITKKIDLTKPPSIRVSVPNYNGKWNVEIYDTSSKQIFPCDNENMTPIDFIPKQSNVACVIQCGGLWFGGKGFGVTFRLVQCVVKPKEVVSVFGKCHVQLSADDILSMDKVVATDALPDDEEEYTEPVVTKSTTEVEDSDEEVVEEEEEEEAEPEPEPVKKKVVKKAVPVESPVAVEEAPKVVKKVVKKKV